MYFWWLWFCFVVKSFHILQNSYPIAKRIYDWYGFSIFQMSLYHKISIDHQAMNLRNQKGIFWRVHSTVLCVIFLDGKTYKELWGRFQLSQDCPLDCQQCRYKCRSDDGTHLEWRPSYHSPLFHQRVKDYSAMKK